MKLTRVFILIIFAAFFLAACSNTPPEITPAVVQVPIDDATPVAVQETNLPSDQPDAQTTWPDGEQQQDDQGQVEVVITPLNLSYHDQTLDFDVAMDTHSVDLSMDLAALAELSTDTGVTVNATTWSAPGGGHHASGALSFPAIVDGAHLLDNVSSLTLTIYDVDAPERVFAWNLSE